MLMGEGWLMKMAWAAAALILSPILAGCGRVTCDRFNLQASLAGNELTVSLDTDLPDYTGVIVGVRRLRQELGDLSAREPGRQVGYMSTRPTDYFRESSTVGRWRMARTITLDHAQWERDAQAAQRHSTGFGDRFQFTHAESDIELHAVVHATQTNPKFGENNRNFRGSDVEECGSLRIVYKELRFACPLK